MSSSPQDPIDNPITDGHDETADYPAKGTVSDIQNNADKKPPNSDERLWGKAQVEKEDGSCSPEGGEHNHEPKSVRDLVEQYEDAIRPVDPHEVGTSRERQTTSNDIVVHHTPEEPPPERHKKLTVHLPDLAISQVREVEGDTGSVISETDEDFEEDAYSVKNQETPQITRPISQRGEEPTTRSSGGKPTTPRGGKATIPKAVAAPKGKTEAEVVEKIDAHLLENVQRTPKFRIVAQKSYSGWAWDVNRVLFFERELSEVDFSERKQLSLGRPEGNETLPRALYLLAKWRENNLHRAKYGHRHHGDLRSGYDIKSQIEKQDHTAADNESLKDGTRDANEDHANDKNNDTSHEEHAPAVEYYEYHHLDVDPRTAFDSGSLEKEHHEAHPEFACTEVFKENSHFWSGRKKGDRIYARHHLKEHAHHLKEHAHSEAQVKHEKNTTKPATKSGAKKQEDKEIPENDDHRFWIGGNIPVALFVKYGIPIPDANKRSPDGNCDIFRVPVTIVIRQIFPGDHVIHFAPNSTMTEGGHQVRETYDMTDENPDDSKPHLEIYINNSWRTVGTFCRLDLQGEYGFCECVYTNNENEFPYPEAGAIGSGKNAEEGISDYTISYEQAIGNTHGNHEKGNSQLEAANAKAASAKAANAKTGNAKSAASTSKTGRQDDKSGGKMDPNMKNRNVIDMNIPEYRESMEPTSVLGHHGNVVM